MNCEPRTANTGANPLRFFVVAGPTAVGKSDLAVEVAERLKTEIVGADAFQIYQGFEILSGKPSPALQNRVKHHLVGILPVGERCDAVRYAALARSTIKDLNRKGLAPLLVGGSGFYIESLLNPLPSLPPVDPELRVRLAQQTLESLLVELQQTDPEAFARIDRHNRRRIERAIEVIRTTGTPFSSYYRQNRPLTPGLLLNRPRPALHTRIDHRVRWMLENGAIEEVASTVEIGPTARQMIGVKEIQRLLGEKISKEECIRLIQAATRQYAKRQITWFKRQPMVPFDADHSADEAAEFFKRHTEGW